MEVENDNLPPANVIDREKTSPFLVRTFLKVGSFHRVMLFDDGTVPTVDEHQIYTWRDATLKEFLTTLRACTPSTDPTYRHPLARYSFRALYADSTNRGLFTTKEMGTVYSRDILGEPGSLVSNSEEDGSLPLEPEDRPLTEKTLDDLRFVPGDYMLVCVMLPKTVTGDVGLAIKGSAPGPGAGPVNGNARWGAGRGADNGWRTTTPVTPVSGGGGFGRGGGGGGHWRARPGVAAPPAAGRGAAPAAGNVTNNSEALPSGPRGAGPRRDRDADRDRDRGGDRDRDNRERERFGRGGRRSPSRERERDRRDRDRTPPRRRSRSRSRSRSHSRSPLPRRARR